MSEWILIITVFLVNHNGQSTVYDVEVMDGFSSKGKCMMAGGDIKASIVKEFIEFGELPVNKNNTGYPLSIMKCIEVLK